MRTSTWCMLGVTLAAAASCGHQAAATALTVRTPTPAVHVPPPKVTVHAPKMQMNETAFTKKTDKSTVTLFPRLATGKHYK
jgi:type VI protein secretion system component Hcp